MPDEPARRSRKKDRQKVPHSPQGWQRVMWLGPAFLWILSAAGSGELLFTPRVAAQYGYVLLWALIAAVALKWFANHELGRFTATTGSPALQGFADLPGPKNWAVWVIMFAELFFSITIVAGMAATTATAVILVAPGSFQIWATVLIVISTALVIFGRYGAVQTVATYLSLALAIAAIVAAILVKPDVSAIGAGLVPQLPADVDYTEILPWLGFTLAGGTGLMWYSYWLTAKGYGAAKTAKERDQTLQPKEFSRQDRERAKGWIGQMTLDNTVAIVGTLLPTIAFLILGAELLMPRGLVPEGPQLADTLGRLLGGLWGPVGYWFLIAGLFIGFWGTLLANQDGLGRLLSDGTEILLRQVGVSGKWVNTDYLKNAYLAIYLTVIPIILIWVIGKPVGLLKAAGAIDAALIPVAVGFALYLNHRTLPKELRPGWIILIGAFLAVLFFAAFAVLYVLQLLGYAGAIGLK